MGPLLNTFGGKRPNITAAQWIGALAAGIGPALTLAGTNLSADQLAAVDDLKVVGLGLIGADAFLRIGRNIKDGRVEAAGLAAAGEPPVGPTEVPASNGFHVPTLPGMAAPVEAPLAPEEIAALDDGALEAGYEEDLAPGELEEDLTGDLEDHATAIEEEELTGVGGRDAP